MTEYILWAIFFFAGCIIAYFVTLLSFQSYIEKKSLENKPHSAFGKLYWFMTQDQIQNAVKSIILMEKHAKIKTDNE